MKLYEQNSNLCMVRDGISVADPLVIYLHFSVLGDEILRNSASSTTAIVYVPFCAAEMSNMLCVIYCISQYFCRQIFLKYLVWDIGVVADFVDSMPTSQV